jgi:hypothetical protein
MQWAISESSRPSEASVARLLFIVSAAAPGRYAYLKHVFANEGGDVIVDRRGAERRRGWSPRSSERRRGERRRRDVMGELRSSGWALVRR